MKIKHLFQEGLSNYNDELRQDIIEFFKKKWDECSKKRKSGDWINRKIYKDKKTGGDVEIVTLVSSKRQGPNIPSCTRTVVSDVSKLDLSGYSSLFRPSIKNGIYVLSVIKLNLSNYDHSNYDSEDVIKKEFARLISTLEHEVTHISQEINGMIKFYTDASQKYQYSYKKYSGHAERPYEKEAELVALFSTLKNRGAKAASEYLNQRLAYFIGLDYKTFLKKAADYGITNSEVVALNNYLSIWWTGKTLKDIFKK